MPDAITSGISIFNDTIRTTTPTQTNNPFQVYFDLGTLRWMAVSDLFIWDFKNQVVTLPLTDSSEYNCWGEAILCDRLNDPTDPTYIAEMERRAANEKIKKASTDRA